MKISWCQEHESGTASSDESCDLFLTGRYSVPCRMVPMRLIPDNAHTLGEVVMAIAGGPHWNAEHTAAAHRVLAALDGETP